MADHNYFLFIGLFIVIFGLGYWLARLGKPYNVAIQTVHKLVGVGVFVYLIFSAVQINKGSPLNVGQFIILVVNSIFFLLLIATGGMLATENEFPRVVLMVHKIVPYLTVVTSGVSFYLLGV